VSSDSVSDCHVKPATRARLRRMGIGIGLTVLVALSFRLLDLLSGASQALRIDVAAVLTRSDVPKAWDDVFVEHHAPSLCCEEFVRGGQLSLLFVLLSGLPMALAACTAALATRRRSPRPWSRSAYRVFQACFVVQWSSFMLSALLTLAGLWIDWRMLIAEWQGVFLLVTMTASALALPAWRVAAVGEPLAPVSIIGRRSKDAPAFVPFVLLIGFAIGAAGCRTTDPDIGMGTVAPAGFIHDDICAVNGSLDIRVTDPLGAPIEGAEVWEVDEPNLQPPEPTLARLRGSSDPGSVRMAEELLPGRFRPVVNRHQAVPRKASNGGAQ
jgi:hypothetical protein